MFGIDTGQLFRPAKAGLGPAGRGQAISGFLPLDVYSPGADQAMYPLPLGAGVPGQGSQPEAGVPRANKAYPPPRDGGVGTSSAPAPFPLPGRPGRKTEQYHFALLPAMTLR